MDSKEVKQIFHKFYRTRKAEESGEAAPESGCRSSNRLWNNTGQIEVTSKPGEGSCFTLVLPAAILAPAPVPRNDIDATTLISRRRSRIAVYDSDCAGSQRLPGRSGLHTGDAIDRLAVEAYPIVVSDIYIDERTGLDVLDAAKRKDRCLGDSDDRARDHRDGDGGDARRAFDYIAKPFDLDVLLDAITRAEIAHDGGDDEAEEESLPETEMIGISPGMVEVYKTFEDGSHTRR